MARKLLNTKEAADLLGVTVGRVRKLILDGRIKATKEGTRDWLIPIAEIRKFKPRPSGAAGHIRRRRVSKPKPEEPAAVLAA